MKPAVLLLALLSLGPVSSAFAQTFPYDARVTSAIGDDAAAFSPGDRILISYTLDPSAADIYSDPSAGIFVDAVLSLSVSLPDKGISVVTGASGTAQTFNNFPNGPTLLTDQVYIIGGPVSSASMLGGAPIQSVEVDFLSERATPPDEPTMLASDALPLFQLPVVEAFVILTTANGTTFVNFELCPVGQCEQPSVCTVTPTYANGTLTMNFTLGTPAPAQWHVALLAVGNVYTFVKTTVAATASTSFPAQFSMPPLGTVAVLSTLTTSTGLTCTDLETVDTSASARH